MTSTTWSVYVNVNIFFNLIFKFSWSASEFLRILNVVFWEMTGNDIPIDHGLQARKYFMIGLHNFVNCKKKTRDEVQFSIYTVPKFYRNY